MAYANYARYATPATLVVGFVAIGLIIHSLKRLRYNLRLKRIGGQQLPKVARNSLSAFAWLLNFAKAQYKNRFLEYFDDTCAAGTQGWTSNACEVNIMGSQRYILTREPEHMKTVLTGKFSDFGKGDEFHRIWEPFLGNSIFTTDAQLWQDSRSLLRPLFIKNRVSDLHIFERWTQKMFQVFPSSGTTFNIQDYLYRMTIDVITDFLLGHSTNSLDNPRNEFVAAFSSVQRWQTMLTLLTPVEKLVPRRQYFQGIAVIERFIQPFIDEALTLSPEKLAKTSSDFTFLHALAGYTRDPKVIRDQIVAVLLAGRDTTAATLSWFMYEVANAPGCWQKIRQEVVDLVGQAPPSYDDLKRLKYVNNAINETLRKYPAVPFNVRYALVDTTLPSCVVGRPDIPVVAGDMILYSTMSMQRRKDLYPPSSPTFAPIETFSPERWDHWQPRPWHYLPFNGGPRICVGQHFALTEMAYIIARLAQRYSRVEYGGDWQAQFHKVEIVGCPGDGVNVALFEDEN